METTVCACGHAVEHAKDILPGKDEIEIAAELFKLCGDATRVGILCALSRHHLCVSDLAQVLEMSSSAISHQLRIIKQARLVKARRDGKTIFYSLADDHVKEIIGMAKEHLEEET